MLTFGAVAEGHALRRALEAWLSVHGLTLVAHGNAEDLPGSYWGAPEAGIETGRLHVRDDTPLHSLLHEACHIVCARAAGRPEFARDAGSDGSEEDAVCLLQLIVADRLPDVGWRRLAVDMDAWGYRFMAGSTAAWFRRDSAAAWRWLDAHGLAQRVAA
ncbi:MAG: hypothetical protein AAFY69_04950 [Pseudomonadota bacterium]